MMTIIQLASVDDTNCQACLELIITPEQLRFVPDIASSLEMANRYDQARPLAILADSAVVGFCLYGVDQETGKWKIYRLLIGAEWQRNGFGRQAMICLIKRICELHGAQEILLVYHQENEAAERLYERLGFVIYQRRGIHNLAKLTVDEEPFYDSLF